jgi:hypothetical protein
MNIRSFSMTVVSFGIGAANGLASGSAVFFSLQGQSQRKQLMGVAALNTAVAALFPRTHFSIGLKLGMLASSAILIANSSSQFAARHLPFSKANQLWSKRNHQS